MDWGIEEIDMLKRLYANGLSASQIATELPVNVTRNAVIGKIHRLGLEKRGKKFKLNNPKPRKPRPKSSLLASQWISGGLTIRAPSPINFIDTVLDPLNISFAEIHDGMCKSIANHDMTAPLYCGRFVSEGSHYCGPHRRLYYYPGKRQGAREATLVPA